MKHAPTEVWTVLENTERCLPEGEARLPRVVTFELDPGGYACLTCMNGKEVWLEGIISAKT